MLDTNTTHSSTTDRSPRRRRKSEYELMCARDREGMSRLSAWAELHTVCAGEDIVREGELGDAFYAVVSGQVAVLVHDDHADDGTATEVARLGAGEVFGEMAAAMRQPRCATVRATETCQVLRFDGPCLRQTLRAHTELYAFMVELGLARTEHNLWQHAV